MKTQSLKSSTQSESERSRTTLRDWKIDLKVPAEVMPRVVDSCLTGFPLKVENEHTNVLLCAMPKSASLHMTQLLSLSLGLKNHQVGFNRSGGSLYYPRLLSSKFVGGDTISHCHAHANPSTLNLIVDLNLRPMVLTRNLLDALCSRRDMLLRDQRAGNFNSAVGIERFLNASHAEQMDWIIDLFAPDYLDFYASWSVLKDSGEVLFLTYAEMRADEAGLVQRVARSLGREVSREHVEQVSASIAAEGGINMSPSPNVGGASNFSLHQIQRLQALAGRLGCSDAEFLGF